MCAVWSVSVGQHPQTGPVPAEDFEPRMPPVGEHKQRALPGIFAETLGHQRVQAIEPLAHVAGFHCHEYLQAAGKTQHGRSNARSNATTSGSCVGSLSSSLAPPGNVTTSDWLSPERDA